MKTFYSVSLLCIEIIQLRLAMLKYSFLVGFYSVTDDTK